MPSNEFKREPRYIVFKVKDALAHLSACQLDRLQEIGETVATGRSADGKPPLNVVVVEQDWPEFEPTWAAIEARMTGRAIEAEVLQAQAPIYQLHDDSVGSFTDVEKDVFDESKLPDCCKRIVYTAPQPPAPCQRCEDRDEEDERERRDFLDQSAENEALQVKVAKQAALIEKCEKALDAGTEWGISKALAAIAAMKGGAK